MDGPDKHGDSDTTADVVRSTREVDAGRATGNIPSWVSTHQGGQVGKDGVSILERRRRPNLSQIDELDLKVAS